MEIYKAACVTYIWRARLTIWGVVGPLAIWAVYRMYWRTMALWSGISNNDIQIMYRREREGGSHLEST